MSTLLLWSKYFYTTIGPYSTLYDFLAITPKDIPHLDYYQTSQQMFETKTFLTYSITTTCVLGEVSHHMHESGESDDMSVCHTTNKTCPSVCQ